MRLPAWAPVVRRNLACRTGTIAERKAAEKLEELGINSTQTFRESTSNVTFKEQGEVWLRFLSNRKRNPLEQTTIDTRRYALDKWMYPFFGERYLADVTNLAMKEFVDHISSLKPAKIRDYVNVVKAVVASARANREKCKEAQRIQRLLRIFCKTVLYEGSEAPLRLCTTTRNTE